MQLSITGHHINITPALRNYVDNKLERLERHFENVTDIHCVLSVEKLRHKAEATVQVSGTTLFADEVQEDMYAAIDGLVDKLNRRVKKHKGKRRDHHARDAQKSRYL